jgi:sulfite dehydrogenase
MNPSIGSPTDDGPPSSRPADPVRRQFLRAAAAGGAAAGLGACASAPVASRASTAPATSIGRVVIVGGGFGGATVARYLRLWEPRVEVTLVDRHARYFSCPMSNLVIGGWRDMADIALGWDGLRAAGVKWVQSEVRAVDPAARTLRLADGRDLAYDRLVLSPGVDFITDGIAGLAEALESGRVLHAWKAGPETAALRAQLQAMPDGGVVALSIPKAPFRCPPGPYERACLVASYLKAQKPRSKLLVMDANPEVQSKKALFEGVFRDHYRDILEYRPDSELIALTGHTATPRAHFEFEELQADVLNVIPPQRGADLLRRAGLLDQADRWAGVHWLTMESTAAPGVHVLGDAVLSAPGMPKSGHLANQQGKLVAAALIQLLQGLPVNPEPLLMNTCYSYATPTLAMHVANVYRYDPTGATFRTVAGAGGLSVAPSELEATYARAWADNIWADTLAG